MSQRQLTREKKMQDFLNKFPDIARLRDNKLNSKVNTISEKFQSPPTASSILPVSPLVSQRQLVPLVPMRPMAQQRPIAPVMSIAQQRPVASQRPVAQPLSLPHFMHIAPVMQSAIVVNHGSPPGNLVTVDLGGGLGNWIFMILAGLGYAEKYGKQFVLSNEVIQGTQSGKKQPHELNLEPYIKRIFPGLTYVDSVNNATEIKEFKEAQYSFLPNASSNVILKGYFQNELYFPSKSKIPIIKTGYYTNTYFVHIRAGDYLGDPTGFGYNKDIYYSNCFNLIGPDISYIVFSNDNSYAENYMKQFNVKYTLSDKTDALETLIEMTNCAGGICTNSSLSWLAGFFQGDTRGKVFFPLLWHRNFPESSKFLGEWATIVCVNSSSNPLIRNGVNKYNGSQCKLSEWQHSLKEPSSLIVQASSICGCDLWMPFPIGMSWQYVKYFNNSKSWQVGSHDNLLLCAISSGSDSTRRSGGINREKIINTLQNNKIQNVILSGEIYFSSLPTYKFVISPEGNGIDCHRHYEALLAGCIPIIEYNDQIQAKYKGLPILYTKDYSEITSEYLEKKYTEMIQMPYDFSRLFLSYYTLELQEEIKKCGEYWIKKICGQETDWYSPSIVWITLINKGYIDFTKNFVESMKRNNCIFNLIVYCTDADSIEALKEYSNITCLDAKQILKFTMSESLSTWGALEYKRLVFAKLDAIKHALSKYNAYIGYIDTDIILFKNPSQTIANTFKLNPDTVFVSQCDEGVAKCSNTSNCQHFCSGVIVFKNQPVVYHLLEYNDNDIESSSSDQMHLLNIANKYNVKHLTVDKNIFLNGVYPGVNNYDVPLIVPNSAELIHYNYLTGINKMKLMQKNNMWYI